MSSGGIDWAYRMIAAHKLDGLGVAVVLHLGLRDHPNHRTVMGISRALNRDHSSVHRALKKLVGALGILTYRHGHLVATETVHIVEGVPVSIAPVADGPWLEATAVAEDACGPRPRDAVASGYQSGGPKPPLRKEQEEKKAKPSVRRGFRADVGSASLACSDGVGGSAVCTGSVPRCPKAFAADVFPSLVAFSLERLRVGQSFWCRGETVAPGSAEFDALNALRLERCR